MDIEKSILLNEVNTINAKAYELSVLQYHLEQRWLETYLVKLISIFEFMNLKSCPDNLLLNINLDSTDNILYMLNDEEDDISEMDLDAYDPIVSDIVNQLQEIYLQIPDSYIYPNLRPKSINLKSDNLIYELASWLLDDNAQKWISENNYETLSNTIEVKEDSSKVSKPRI